MRTEFADRLIERAERDDGFSARLLCFPEAAISEELGVEIPDSLNIRVIEEAPSEVIMALPAKAAPSRAERVAAGQCRWRLDLVVVHSRDAVHLLIDG